MTNTEKSKKSWGAGSHIRLGLFSLALLVGGLGTWSATAKLAGAVIAQGQLRVESKRQVVQHPDGGVVGEILVREGDRVEAGDVLIRLDGNKLRSDLAVLESQLYEIMARRARLVAEQSGSDTIEFDEELIEVARERPELQSLISGQLSLFEARATTLQRERDMLIERQEQTREEIRGSEAEIASYERQAALIAEELEGQRKLLKKGLAQANRVLALEREAARLEGERGQLISRAAQLKGRIAETGIEIVRLEANQREEAISQLRDIGYRELELKEKRIALREQLSRLDIKAPRSGIVYDMSIHTLNSVIRPAEPILYIVPTDTALVVDAKVAPVNVDEIHAGQEAVLRFSAFSSRTTPEIIGMVAQVSPDALTDQKTGITYYRAEITISDAEIAKLEGRPLMPGMPVDVFIQTGERTPFSYLMKPFTDYFYRAMRET